MAGRDLSPAPAPAPAQRPATTVDQHPWGLP